MFWKVYKITQVTWSFLLLVILWIRINCSQHNHAVTAVGQNQTVQFIWWLWFSILLSSNTHIIKNSIVRTSHHPLQFHCPSSPFSSPSIAFDILSFYGCHRLLSFCRCHHHYLSPPQSSVCVGVGIGGDEHQILLQNKLN